MIYINNLEDCHLIDTPELYREVTSYLLYCRMELLEYEDEEDVDDHDFSFSVLQDSDLSMLTDLGPPEEIVQISIKADNQTFTIHRIIYPTEVLFIPNVPDIVITRMLQSENGIWLNQDADPSNIPALGPDGLYRVIDNEWIGIDQVTLHIKGHRRIYEIHIGTSPPLTLFLEDHPSLDDRIRLVLDIQSA